MRAGIRRQEGAEKVAGSIRFTADLDLAGLLHVQLVLSHLPSALIKRVDGRAALSVPGVAAVVTGQDLGVSTLGGPDKPLAEGRVHYVGQPVVAVLAESEAAAADGAALVEIEYEELEATVEAAAAVQDGSPLVLPEGDDEDEAEEEAKDGGEAGIHGASAGDETEPIDRPRNVSAIAHLKRGDTDAALAAADVVVSASYDLSLIHI